jgi:hypothetical protein
MRVLAPTTEEIPGEKPYEKLVLDPDYEVNQNAMHLHERDGLKATQSTQTFQTAPSEQVGKSNREQPIAEKTEATSHVLKHELISTESRVKNPKEATEDDQDDSNVDRQVLKKHGSSGDNAKNNAVGVDKPEARQIYTSPFHDKQKQSEESSKQPRAISSPLGGSNHVQSQPEAFSQIPTGIVSSRLRGIAASGPGLDRSSGFYGLLTTDHKGVFPQKRRINTTTGGSPTFKYFPQDPLSRVSQEEDVASLASLAEVILSQGEIVCLDSLSKMDFIKRPDTPANINKSRTRSTVSVTPISELHRVESSTKPVNRKDVEEGLAFTTKVSPADTDRLPITPRRSVTESSVPRQSGGSVKALAARFENVEMKAKQTPSPVHTPDSKVWHGSLVEKAVVALYTVNTSPGPMAPKLTRSDTSLQIIRDPVQVKIRAVVSPSRLENTASPLLRKPLFSGSFFQEDSGPPRWPKLRPVDRSPRRHSDLIQMRSNRVTLSPFSSSLHRTGDRNVSFGLSRKSSLGTILPRPNEPQVAEHMNFARPSAMYPDCDASPLDLATCSHFVNNGMSGSSVVSPRPKNQGASILYTQIQHLSRQLRAKADEADHLRRQLMTKDSLHDLGTLSQQLRLAKRELSVWRGRAEVAEKRLEMLSQQSQKEVDEGIADKRSATDLSGFSGNYFVKEGGGIKTKTRDALHGLDGICTEFHLPGSDETIRRTKPEQWYSSETVLDNV